jgi:hypothetical protein
VSLFERLWGRTSSPASAVEPHVATTPIAHPVERLEFLLGARLEALCAEGNTRPAAGHRVGRIVEVTTPDGGFTQRFRSYRHMAEAVVDERLAVVEADEGVDSPRAVQIRRLAPVAVRWSLLRDRDDLSDAAATGTPSWGLKTSNPVPEPPSLSLDGGAGAAIRAVRLAQQSAIVRRHAELAAARERELLAEPAVDASAQRMAISRELVRWAEMYPDLDREARLAEATAAAD